MITLSNKVCSCTLSLTVTRQRDGGGRPASTLLRFTESGNYGEQRERKRVAVSEVKWEANTECINGASGCALQSQSSSVCMLLDIPPQVPLHVV